MPHVTTGCQQFKSGKTNNSWSSEIYNFMVRKNASPNRTGTTAAKHNRREVDQSTFLARLGLVASQSNSTTPLFTESRLTRSPIRSQICREVTNQPVTLRNLADVDFSSKLGQLLLNQFDAVASLENNSISMIDLVKHERFCDGMYIESNGRPHQLRTRAQVDFPITYTLDKRFKKRSNHVYCFNNKQRKDRKKTINTGLNKRARLLKRQCKPCSVVLERLNLDPKCRFFVEKIQEKFPQNTIPKTTIPNPNTLQATTLNSKTPQLPRLRSDTSNSSANSSLIQLKINDMFAADKLPTSPKKLDRSLNIASTSGIGKEIILDGNVVIDLCSDDESDEVIVKPKSQMSTNSINSVVDNLINRQEAKAVNNECTSSNFVNNSSRLLDCRVALMDVLESIVVAPDGQMYISNTQTDLNSSKKVKCSPHKICTSNVTQESNDSMKKRRNSGETDSISHKLESSSSKRSRSTTLQSYSDGKSSDLSTRSGGNQQKRYRGSSSPKERNSTSSKQVNSTSKNYCTRSKKMSFTSYVVQFKCYICNYISYVDRTLLKERIDKHVSFYHGGYNNIILVRRTSQTTGHVVIELKSELE